MSESHNVIFTNFVLDCDGQKPLEFQGRILCHVLKDGEPDTMFIVKEDLINRGILNESEQSAPTEEHIEDDCPSEDNNDNIWTDNLTKFVLDKYHEYLPEIGPLNKFKVKKRMWQQISGEIKNKFNVSNTAQQVENRFKTVLKRKKGTTNINRKTGEVRQKVDYEEELEKIASQDHSVEPELLKGQSKVIINKEVKKYVKRSSLCALLKEIGNEKKKQKEEHFKQKEDQKERRHKEKMDLLKQFLEK